MKFKVKNIQYKGNKICGGGEKSLKNIAERLREKKFLSLVP